MAEARSTKRARTDDAFAELQGAVANTEVTSLFPAAAAAPVIGTHSGTFHCDEALACAMLKLLPRFRHSSVVRSRDPATLTKCDIVVDVGAEYDPARQRLDHHQASFTQTYDAEHVMTKLSSAGLVYKHFGREVVDIVAAAAAGAPLRPDVLDGIVRRIYDNFIQEIDAIDNGVEVAAGELRYRIRTGLSSRVARLNPAWNEPSTDADANAAFKEAMAITLEELIAAVAGLVRYWLPAREIVERAVRDATKVHPSGAILRLDQFCPWKEHLFQLEEELGGEVAGRAKYAVFADSSGSWRVQAVPHDSESFASRQALPAAWRGIRDDELSKVSGVPGCIFVHAAGFIGGNKTEEGALAMAIKALSTP